MTTPRPGRFTEAATTAQTRPPIGASRREGWAGLALAGVEGVSLAVMFQAQNLAWGGIVLWATLCLMLVGILVVSVWASRERGVHRRGFTRDLLLAGGWLLLWIAACGWFWIAHGHHSTGAFLTTAAATVAVLPMALVFGRLVREGS